MTHKVHPLAFRLGYTADWKSRWFNRKKYREFLKQDYYLREFIMKKLNKAGLKEVEISRSANLLSIKIHSSRPGIVIGRGGVGVQELKKEIMETVLKGAVQGLEVKIDIEEVKNPEAHAQIVAQNIAEQLERRMPFRRIIKRIIDKVMETPEVQGIKVAVSGRLNGAEMARQEKFKEGKIPLQTLRADIDFAIVRANTTYGVIGVKVWIYKGEKFA